MTQADFVRALLDPLAPIPAGIVGPDGLPAPRRFGVYRNTVALSLTRALEAAFPTVRKLVGDAFFAAMAGLFLRDHPPRSRQLMLYGDALPAWLERFPPVAHLGYLPDVARLDQAMRESYHAADGQPLAQDLVQRLPGLDAGSLRLRLAPSLRLVRSRWPIAAIWAAQHEDGPAPAPGGQDVVVLRAGFDPRPLALPKGGADFTDGLLRGLTLGESLDLAGETLDLAAVLGLLVSHHAVQEVLP